ncbi:hypothetical protein CAPTEDRAFT_187197 [Capitella teleta]|uniref:Uncharacterized protein n=1 Tax=Capitella teleta TaxID=283909 RepID=R7V8R0_CAPTE|nr:hypothetical protein CAPTEDRAFT_187197 [Capitella teleta]|eukprot:ELU15213.1 hypothetical protein CAPTEDRAFT_187197 [Capitella teleta]
MGMARTDVGGQRPIEVLACCHRLLAEEEGLELADLDSIHLNFSSSRQFVTSTSVWLHKHVANNSASISAVYLVDFDSISIRTVDKNRAKQEARFSAIGWRHHATGNISKIKKFVQEHHRYPDYILWDQKRTSFQPSACRLIEFASLEDCLAHSSISTIAVYGDSQGWRYGLALKGYLSRHKMPCQFIANEKRRYMEPDLEYLSRGNDQLRARMQPTSHSCSSCSGFRAKCTSLSTNKTVNIEYIDTEGVMSKYVTLRAGNGSKAVPTFEEFIFEVYLKDSFPDLNVFFVPMNHIKHKPFEYFTYNFPRLLSIIKANKPPHSEIYFIPGTAESEEAMTSRYRNTLFYGVLATGAIRRLNEELFAMLEPELVNATSNIYSFLDLVEVTSPVLGWSVDGVHFDRKWYAAFWKSYFSFYCDDYSTVNNTNTLK